MSPAKRVAARASRPVVRTGPRAFSDPPSLPVWFETTLAILLCALLGFALAALPLAMLEWFRPLPVAAGTAAATAVLLSMWRPVLGRTVSPEARASAPAAWVLLLLVVVAVAVNLTYSSEHLLANRDPGVYVTTARWLADEGTLLIDARRGPYEDVEGRFALGHGYYDAREDGKLYAQFLHLLPATLAVGAWIGDSWLLVRGNAVIGGLALLMVFAFAARMMRPWFALATVAALAVSLPQVHFTRDAYAEILTQVFLFGGLWVLWGARSRLDLGRGAIAGMLVGATCMVRIDSLVFLVPLLGYLVYELWCAGGLGGEIRRARRMFVAAIGGGAAVPVGIGLANGFLFSPVYLQNLSSSLLLVAAAVAVVVVGGALLLAARRVVRPMGKWMVRHRWVLGTLGVLVIVAGVTYAFAGRPHLEYNVGRASDHIGGLQSREGLEVDPRRRFDEMSMWWLMWYLGPLLFVGVLGLARAVWRVSGGRERRLLPFLLIFCAMTALYVWRPSIFPDQIWAIRRFLPVTIPGFILLGFWLAAGLWGWRGRLRTLMRTGAVAIVIAGIGFSAWTLAPVAETRTQHGMLAATEQLCETLSEDTVVVLRDRGLMAAVSAQTVRSFCRVPVAVPPRGEPPGWFEQIARRQHERAGRVIVLGPSDEPIQSGGRIVVPEPFLDVTWEILERKLSGRPDDFEQESFTVFIAELPPP